MEMFDVEMNSNVVVVVRMLIVDDIDDVNVPDCDCDDDDEIEDVERAVVEEE